MAVVSDVFFDNDEKTSPPFATLFRAEHDADGRSTVRLTPRQKWRMDAGRGFSGVEVRDLPPPNPHSLVIGFKP
jgi:hypothetical protein